MTGSSKLTPEQQEFYAGRFPLDHGGRYLAVQEQPQRPSRKQRRAAKFKRGER